MEFINYFLLMFVRRAPMLLLCVGGILFAVIRWKRHPRVSLITVLALALYLVEAFVFTAFRYWIPSLVDKMGFSSRSIGTIFTVISVLDDFAYAAIILLLVAAAFIGRGKPTETTAN